MKQLSRVYETDKISLTAIEKLITGEALAVCIPNYRHYPHLNLIEKRVSESKEGSSYTFRNNLVSHIGLSSYEIDLDEERFNKYYSLVDDHYHLMEGIFSPEETPIQQFLDNLNQLWPKGACLDELHQKKMFAGIIRTIHQGSMIHAHQDLVAWSNPNAKNVADVKKQFGLNYYLKAPKDGGHLYMWDKSLNKEEFDQRASGGFCIPLEDLPPPDIRLKPEAGMLMLLNTHCLHAIERSNDSDRISMSCFVGYRGDEAPMTIWS